MNLIFHLALPDDWSDAVASGQYTTSTRGRTLDEEGFIHASTRDQLAATAARFYSDIDRLVLLSIDTDRLDCEVKWEPPDPSLTELFPHIYGPVPISAVVDTSTWTH